MLVMLSSALNGGKFWFFEQRRNKTEDDYRTTQQDDEASHYIYIKSTFQEYLKTIPLNRKPIWAYGVQLWSTNIVLEKFQNKYL